MEGNKNFEGSPIEAAEAGSQRLDVDALQQTQQMIQFRPMPPTLLPVKGPQ